MPSIARDFVSLAGCLRISAESYAQPVFRIRETTKTFFDEMGLMAAQVYGACPLNDNAFLGFTPESNEKKSARNLEERTFAYELEELPDRYVHFLMRANSLIQTQCERQIQTCVHLLERVEKITHYEPLEHLKNAFAEISVALVVENISRSLLAHVRPTLHIHRVIHSDTGGAATAVAASEPEMDD